MFSYVHILLSDTTQMPQNPFIQLKFYNILLALVGIGYTFVHAQPLEIFLKYTYTLNIMYFTVLWGTCVRIQVIQVHVYILGGF